MTSRTVAGSIGAFAVAFALALSSQAIATPTGKPANPASAPSTKPPATTPPVIKPPVRTPPARTPPVFVFYAPHPDDETLSMSVLIANAVQRGDRVIVVSLTDGRGSLALATLRARLKKPVQENDVARMRSQEMQRAVAKLGVKPADLHFARFNGTGSQSGKALDGREVRGIIAFYAKKYPTATHVTMSDIADLHTEHRVAGRALRTAVLAKTVTSARWAVSRLTWSRPIPRAHYEQPTTAAARAAIRRALSEYTRWDPRRGYYATGLLSVPSQFAAMRQQPLNKWHS